MMSVLEEIISKAPRTPGVYLMKDAAGDVLYVGKAKNIRARLRNYTGGGDARGMIPFLLSRVCGIEWILTNTEKEALILEHTLIKEGRPRYNVDFRDDKAYFHLRVEVTAPYPRFQLVRRPKQDGARYFGPYPSSAAAKETLRFLQTVFPLRTCRDVELRSRRRPCLEYQIGRCLGPCVRLVDDETYRRAVSDALSFMDGNAPEVLRNLKIRMEQAAGELQFEEAAALRDRIEAIRTTLEKQQTALLTAKDQDVFGISREGDLTQLCLLRVRAGKMVGMRNFPLIRINLPTGEIIASSLMQFYDGGHEIPGEILIPEANEDRRILVEWLGEKRGLDVRILLPKRGPGRALIEMANRNAAGALQLARQSIRPEESLEGLTQVLGLRKLPELIECFDISNISGRYAVGSLAAFANGAPCRERYRRFRIRTVSGADDYGMMYEVLKRRFTNGGNLPDLLVVDGGKGQLSVALSVLKDLNIASVVVIALAKERETEDSAKIGDRVFLPGRKDAVNLSRWPPVLFLLQRLRDEAHRFAVAYHWKVREQEDFSSLLDNIPGIGREKKKTLLKGLGDVGAIRATSAEDLRRLPGIGKELAARIVSYFADNEDQRRGS